ncbi:3768_t:CDS:10 [Paraglomus occultum]|uniref:3768_t:CDS:1 n=1 Tax=Paraglomus occultum TaxID=144539 RepID=A0A9N9G088_9GLOM|nr:3768_t:CDS:10 [Paraglomus occultum]
MSFGEVNSRFIQWYKRNGGYLSDKISFKDYSDEGAGRGMIAVEDIDPQTVLFKTPYSLLLNFQTSSLAPLLPDDLFSNLRKHNSWFPLILCLMYESTMENSKWREYFSILQKEYATPMFWENEEIKELKGTGVIVRGEPAWSNLYYREVTINDIKKDKIGKEDAEKGFVDYLLPVIESERGDNDDGEVTMVPMADMLNHKTGFNNARLFREDDGLAMIAIKKITKGEQIYNTYGDLCSADLLRKYGFVDVDNVHDFVEIDRQMVVDTLCNDNKITKEKKVNFLLEENVLDDAFVIDINGDITAELIITAKVLVSPIRANAKLPKPILTHDVIPSLIRLLDKRLDDYKTAIEDDERILKHVYNVPVNLYNAVVVRLSEKKILIKASEKLNSLLKRKFERQKKKRKPTIQPIFYNLYDEVCMCASMSFFLRVSEMAMELPKIRFEIQEDRDNEGFTETTFTFTTFEKLPDNHGCISVSPNGRNIAIVDPDATAIKIYNVMIDGMVTSVNEILLPSNFARKLEAKEVHYSLAISDDCTIAISVFNVSPDTLPDVKWSSELSEVDVSDDNKLCLHHLTVGSTRIIVTQEGKSLDPLSAAGIIRFADDNTVIVLQNEGAFTLFNIKKNYQRKIAYPPTMRERLSLIEVYEQILLLDRCSVGKWLMSNDSSKGLDAFDITSGELIQKFQRIPDNNAALIPFAAISSDSKFLAACDKDGRVNLYLTENGIHVATLRAEIYGHFLFAAFINDDKKLFTIIENDSSYFSVIYELSDFYTNTEYHSTVWHLKKDFGFGNLKKRNPIVQTFAGLFYLGTSGKPTKINVDSIAEYAFSENTIFRDGKKISQKTDEQPHEISNRLSINVSEKKTRALNPFIHDTTDFEPWDRTGRPHRSESLDDSRCLFLIVGEETIQIWEERKALYFWAAHDFISNQSKASADKSDKFHIFDKFEKTDKTDKTITKIEYHTSRRDGNNLILSVKTDDKPEDTIIYLCDIFSKGMPIRQSVVSLVNSLAFIKRIQHQQTSSSSYVRNSKRIRDLEQCTCQAIYDVIANQPDIWQLMDSKYKVMRTLLRAQCDKIITEILKPESHLHRPQFYNDGHHYYESDLTIASGTSRECLRKLLDYYSQKTLELDTVGWMSTFSCALPSLYSKHRDTLAKQLTMFLLLDIIDEFFARSAVFGAMTIDAEKFDYCNIDLAPEELDTVQTIDLIPKLQPPPELDDDDNDASLSVFQKIRHYGLNPLFRRSRELVPEEEYKQARFGTLCLAPLPEFDAYGSSTEWKVRFSRPVFLRNTAEWLSKLSTPSFLLWIPAVNVLAGMEMAERRALATDEVLRGYNGFQLCILLAVRFEEIKAAVGANILMFLDAIGVLKNGSQPITIYSAFAILSLWVQFILMLRVVKGIGHYVSTPISILRHTYRFLIVMALFIIGFGHTIFVLVGSQNNNNDNSNSAGDSTLASNNSTNSTDSSSNDTSSTTNNPFNNIADAAVAVFYWTGGTSPLVTNESFLALTVIMIMGSLILVTMMQNILIALMTAVVELVKEDEKNMILVLRAEYLIVVEEMLLSAKEHNNREWFPKHIYYYSNTDLVTKWKKKARVKANVERKMFRLENKVEEIHEKLAAILNSLKTDP